MVFDRFKERMRQGTGISKDMGHFKGTDNARIEETMKEADDFAHRLKSYKKHLTESSQALDGLLKSTHKTLSADLPRIHDRDAEGNAFGKHTSNNAHQSVRVNGLQDLITQQDAELKAQVFTPIDNWLAVHKEFSNKLKKLDNFRLDLDNARRLHNRSDLERVRHQQKSDNVPDAVLSKIQEHSTELEGRRNAWIQYESEVYAEMINLINEAAEMHTHLGNALRIHANVYQSALASGELSTGVSGPLSGARLSQPGQSGPIGGHAHSPFTTAQGPAGYNAAPQGLPPGYSSAPQGLHDPSYVQMST